MMTMSDATSPWITDAEEATFQQVAVERSREMLVVVDFWATWCQPCRLLGPLLEKLAREYAGKFLLVKAETEKLPNIAAGFGVESIPAVYAMRDGQLLDFFVGLRSEPQLRAWIDRLLPSPAETLVSEAQAIASTAPQEAEGKYREAIRQDPNLASAQIGLAALLLAQGNIEGCRAEIETLEKRGFLEPEAERLKAQLHWAGKTPPSADFEALQAAVAATPTDAQARLALAEACAARGEYETALDHALAVVQSGKRPLMEPARQLMVDVFRLLPDDSELVTTYRRRLSTALY